MAEEKKFRLLDPERAEQRSPSRFGSRAPLSGASLNPAMTILSRLPKAERQAAEDDLYVMSLINADTVGAAEREAITQDAYMRDVGLGTVPRNTGFEFEGSVGDEAEIRQQMYEAGDPEARWNQPDTSLIEPEGEEEPWSALDAFRDTVNFLFSDEMALLGMKWEDEAFSFASENFVHQVTEHPYSTAFTLASYLIPLGLAWQKGARIAGRGAKLAATAHTTKLPGLEVMHKVAGDASIASGKGKLGTQHLGWRPDDHAALVQKLNKLDANDGRVFFDKDTAKALAGARNPAEVSNIVSPKELRKMLMADWQDAEFGRLQKLASRPEGFKAADELGNIPSAWKTNKDQMSWGFRKSFQNRYFENTTAMRKEHIQKMDDYFAQAGLGKMLESLPTGMGKMSDESIFKYWMEGAGRSRDQLAKEVGEEGALWSENVIGKWEDLLVKQYDEGFVDAATRDAFVDPKKIGSGAHIPAIRKGTSDFQDLGGPLLANRARGDYAQMVAQDQVNMAKAMGGPTLKHRGKYTTKAKTLAAMDELEIGTKELFIGGFVKDNVLFQLHRNFRDIMVDAVSNPNSAWADMVQPESAWKGMRKSAQDMWINIDELDKVVPGLERRMRDMVDRRVMKDGLDPKQFEDMKMVRRDVVDNFFGSDGSAKAATGHYMKLFELLTSVHKTMRTAMNLPTHASNTIGNMAFLAMAGMNPFSAQALNDGKIFCKAFRKLAADADTAAGRPLESLMTKDNLAKILGDDQFVVGKLGQQVDLAEILADERMVKLIEAGAFSQAEAFGKMESILGAVGKLEEGGWGAKPLKQVARMINSFREAPGIKPTLRGMSSAYLAEDMIPKMQYIAHLARKGWGMDQIVREVGRRLPQYATVGKTIERNRRVILPWITFPTEATRIMKNNMADMPIQTMVWMQAPAITQSFLSGTGLGPSFDEMTGRMNPDPGGGATEGSAPWANRYQSAMIKGNAASEVLGAVGGAGAGAMAGVTLGKWGGAKGAALGAIGGAIGGALLGHAADDEVDPIREFNRAWTMDFLPQSSMFPASLDPRQWEKVMPGFMPATMEGQDVNRPTPGISSMQTAMNLTPVEPFAVAMPVLEALTGKSDFGEPIETNSMTQTFSKAMLGMVGFLSPPMLQKYGMKLTGPQLNPVAMTEIFEKNGGRMTLPKAVTATFGGLAASTISFLGAGAAMKTAGLAGTALKAAQGAQKLTAGISGAVGALAGSEVNVKRLMVDLGIDEDPKDDEKANWTLDFFANTFFGLNKSWKSNPKQGRYQENLRSKDFAEMRRGPMKQFMDAIKSGRPDLAKAQIAAIRKLFTYEYADTEIAAEKYMDWAERTAKQMGSLAIFAGISEEKLMASADALHSTRPVSTKYRRQQIADANSEIRRRYLNQAKGLTVNTKR